MSAPHSVLEVLLRDQEGLGEVAGGLLASPSLPEEKLVFPKDQRTSPSSRAGARFGQGPLTRRGCPAEKRHLRGESGRLSFWSSEMDVGY